jgi:quinol monooxygenase YgiN
MSIRVTLNCQVKPGLFTALLPFLERNLPNVRSFQGNLMVKILFDEESSEMLLDEEWLSVDNHKAYLRFIQDNGVLSELGRFLAAPPQIKYFKLVEI